MHPKDRPGHSRSVFESYITIQSHFSSPALGPLHASDQFSSRQSCTCKFRVARRLLRASPDEAYRLRTPIQTWNIIWHNSTIKHDKTCPSSLHKSAAGFTLSYCGPFLSRAFHLMLWTTSGTACWGLAPSLFFTPIVSSELGRLCTAKFWISTLPRHNGSR